MGKLKRIQELEEEIRRLNKYGSLQDEVKDYLKELAEMPEDAVLIYRLGDQQKITHQIGMSARILVAKFYSDKGEV